MISCYKWLILPIQIKFPNSSFRDLNLKNSHFPGGNEDSQSMYNNLFLHILISRSLKSINKCQRYGNFVACGSSFKITPEPIPQHNKLNLLIETSNTIKLKKIQATHNHLTHKNFKVVVSPTVLYVGFLRIFMVEHKLYVSNLLSLM